MALPHAFPQQLLPGSIPIRVYKGSDFSTDPTSERPQNSFLCSKFLMQVEGSKHASFLSQESARAAPGSSVYSQSNSPFQTCPHTEGTTPSPCRSTVTAQLTGHHLGPEVILGTRRPSHLGSWHFYCGAHRESCTPPSVLHFFCSSRGSPPQLPTRTGAARHRLLWLRSVLLLLVSSLLNHRAFQKAELSACLAIKEPASRAPSVQREHFSSILEEASQGRSPRMCASGIYTMIDRKASEAKTNKLSFYFSISWPHPINSLLLSFDFSFHPSKRVVILNRSPNKETAAPPVSRK